MGRRVLGLLVKELLVLLRDPKSRFVVVVPPLVQLFVFAYAATFDVTSVRLAVLDDSRTPESRALIARFEGSPVFGQIVRVARPADLGPLVERRRVEAALHITDGFAADLRARPPARVALMLDGRASNSAQIIGRHVAAILRDFGREVAERQGAPQPPSVVVPRAFYNPNLQSTWVIVPGLVGVLTMVVALVVTALSVARERELGTFEQLLVTPLRPVEILVGKTAPALLIALLEASLIVVAALLWFQVPFEGSVLVLYAALVLFILSVVGVGLFISAIVETQQQAIVGAFLFLVPAVILSGFSTPLENMPGWLRDATWINPLRHMMTVLRGVFLKGASADVLAASLWPMAAIAAATLGGASVFFRRRLS